MPFDAAIDELLNRACPSIRYRLRAEILNQPRGSAEMHRLQAEILGDGVVKEVAGWQQPDGWLAWNFHGSMSTECGIRLLCEKGMERDQPLLSRALHALAGADPIRLTRGIGRVGGLLDDLGLGGSQMIRAAVLAYSGVENLPGVQAQIERALAGFAAVLDVHSEADLFDVYRGKRVIRPGVAWPSLYHLRLLAYTRAWRTPHRLDGLVQSVQRLVELSPVPEYNARHGSQLIAPASFCMHDFRPVLAELDAAGWMMEFQRLELLARLGVVSRVAALQNQVAALEEILEAGDGLFRLKLNHAYFKQWGAYTGLMLESDWREAQRRMYDLTFRSLLILHYARS
ncbi:hypothetical protein LARV_00766 [Longilinea arvoryzae]|uniref:Uncharacterized protein n=1 Tax=Longilinea arvoryzae TaxID=360412 RepID=A0A0S7BGS7_9CHLR|nr:hypothetical protein [Longilinea arvoryzae]GAP13025.1 hypothetical protein LARV_00766 [Longilinea arvoryzae]